MTPTFLQRIQPIQKPLYKYKVQLRGYSAHIPHQRNPTAAATKSTLRDFNTASLLSAWDSSLQLFSHIIKPNNRNELYTELGGWRLCVFGRPVRISVGYTWSWRRYAVALFSVVGWCSKLGHSSSPPPINFLSRSPKQIALYNCSALNNHSSRHRVVLRKLWGELRSPTTGGPKM
jgi:hypothetical protein